MTQLQNMTRSRIFGSNVMFCRSSGSCARTLGFTRIANGRCAVIELRPASGDDGDTSNGE